MECDIRQDIGDILAFIGCDLKPFVNIFQLDHGHRVICAKEAGDCLCKDIIGDIFEPVYLDTALPDIIGIPDRTDTFDRPFDLNS